MTQIELDYMRSVPRILANIAVQLQKSNELKALELKLKFPGNECLVDSVMDEGDGN